MKNVMLSLAAVAVGALAFSFLAVPGAAHAAPFLCPVVGDGVLNADSHNGDNGVSTLTPAVGTSFSPGQNQAGENANPNGYNTLNPDNPDAGPGHNPDFSPIWPG